MKPLFISQLVTCAGSLLLTLWMTGCSEMKFVDVPMEPEPLYDSRRDIHLTGVVAEVTSGPALQRRVMGKVALFSEDRNLVEFQNSRLVTFRKNGASEGATNADKVVVYLEDQGTSGPQKRDMVLQGNVRHRSFSETLPTTDTLSLTTEKLVWDEKAQVYKCPTPYRMVTRANARPPAVLKGQKFEATRNMKAFRMWGTGFSNSLGVDQRTSLTQASKKLAAEMTELETKYKAMPLPTPIVIDESPDIKPVQSVVEEVNRMNKTVP